MLKIKKILIAFTMTIMSLSILSPLLLSMPVAMAADTDELSFEMWTLDWDTISVDLSLIHI